MKVQFIAMLLTVLMVATPAFAEGVCQVCDINNLSGGVLSLGSIPAALVCGFLNILFCVPILFVIAMFIVTLIYFWRKLRKP
jgi:hypothetical protein